MTRPRWIDVQASGAVVVLERDSGPLQRHHESAASALLEVDLDDLVRWDASPADRLEHARRMAAHHEAEYLRLATVGEQYEYADRQMCEMAERVQQLKPAQARDALPVRDETAMLRAEVERMRPIADAALTMVDNGRLSHWEPLRRAVDAYRAGTPVTPRPALDEKDCERLREAVVPWLEWTRGQGSGYDVALGRELRELLDAGKLGGAR